MGISAEEAQKVIERSEQIITPEAVQMSVEKLANEITDRIGNLDPVILVVMNGALIPAAHILSRLNFPFQIGYLHATRYNSGTEGQSLKWVAQPSIDIENRCVLVVDDIFDEGITLKVIVDDLCARRPKQVLTATLLNKLHDRKVENFKVDYIGLEVPDRYVFGCGMDYQEYWRNLPGIWALKETNDV